LWILDAEASFLLAYMRDLGWDVLGIEPDEKAANVAKEQMRSEVLPILCRASQK